MAYQILLIIPPKKVFSVIYPLGLGYLAATLKKEHYSVQIANYSLGNYSLSQALSEIIALKPNFIGLTLYSFAYNSVKIMISEIKKKLPETKIAVGGPHASALPLETLKDLKADFSIVGEGEEILPKLIHCLEHNTPLTSLSGIAYWQEGRPIYQSGTNIVKDLDSLPLPDWESMPPFMYHDTAGAIFSKKFLTAPILTSRGCPHHCTFCASYLLHGRKYRKRSPERVVAEIAFLAKTYGVKEFLIFDDTFGEDKQHAQAICEQILKKKLKISWRTPVGVRLDTIDTELLAIFKSSGCYQLGFGIESLSPQILSATKKPLYKKTITKQIELAKKQGIETMGYFILGLPEDTVQSIEETIQFAVDSPLDYLSFTHAVPLPGTPSFEKFYLHTESKFIDWDRFHFYTSKPFKLSTIPPKKLRKLYLKAYLSAYTKPKRALKILKGFTQSQKFSLLKTIKFMYSIMRNLW